MDICTLIMYALCVAIMILLLIFLKKRWNHRNYVFDEIELEEDEEPPQECSLCQLQSTCSQRKDCSNSEDNPEQLWIQINSLNLSLLISFIHPLHGVVIFDNIPNLLSNVVKISLPLSQFKISVLLCIYSIDSIPSESHNNWRAVLEPILGIFSL